MESVSLPPGAHFVLDVKNSVGEDVREGVVVDPAEQHDLDGSRGTANFALKWDRSAKHQVRPAPSRLAYACPGPGAAGCMGQAARPRLGFSTLFTCSLAASPSPRPGLPECGGGQGRDERHQRGGCQPGAPRTRPAAQAACLVSALLMWRKETSSVPYQCAAAPSPTSQHAAAWPPAVCAHHGI